MMKKKVNIIDTTKLSIVGEPDELTNNSISEDSPHLTENNTLISAAIRAVSTQDKAAQASDQCLRDLLKEDTDIILTKIKASSAADEITYLIFLALQKSNLLPEENLVLPQENNNNLMTQLEKIMISLTQPAVPIATLIKVFNIIETQLNAHLELDSDVNLLMPLEKEAQKKITAILHLWESNVTKLENADDMLTIINCKELSPIQKLDIMAQHVEVTMAQYVNMALKEKRNTHDIVSNTRYCYAFSAKILGITTDEKEIQKNGNGHVAKVTK